MNRKFLLIFLISVLTFTGAYAALPPWEYEVERAKSKAVFYGEVNSVEKIKDELHSEEMKICVCIFHTFRNEDTSTTPTAATLIYSKTKEGRKMTVGGKLNYSFTEGDKVLFFADSFTDGNIHSASGNINEISSYQKILELYLLPGAERFSTEHNRNRITDKRLFEQKKLYENILNYLKIHNDGNN